MKIFYLWLIVISLTACAKVSNAPYAYNDANQVTITHGTGTVIQTKYEQAQAYCSRYGKKAYLRAQIDPHNTVFDCK
jgi:hypothetical protein